MNEEIIKRHIGTVQFGLLALIFALPWVSDHALQPVSSKSLSIVLEFEFVVLILGWLTAGLFFVPMAVLDSVWLRRISLLLALVIFWPMTKSYHYVYGWQGGVFIYWLLFANYASVYLRSMALYDRSKLLAEVAARILFYLLLFASLVLLLEMPSNVGSWSAKDGIGLFGLIYFSTLAFIEYKRYFPKGIHFIFYVLGGRFIRVPKRKIRYKNGRLQAHVIKRSRTHYWWLVLGLGVVLTGFLTPFLYATISMDSTLTPKILLWLFLTPFYLIGIASLTNGPWMMYRYFSAPPAWLELRTEALRDYDRLIAEGFVPSYGNADERISIEPVIIAYRLSLPTREDEFIQVKTLAKQVVTKGLIQSNSRRGTRFQIECTIPGPAMKTKTEGTEYVWLLQISVTEKRLNKFTPITSMKKDRERLEHWSLAFTLPV